jgi:hypothetical protein
MTYAILDTNRVVVDIVAHEPSNVDWVRIKPGDGCAIGRIYNGWTFDAQRWTPLQFLGRFTEAELEDIEMRRLTDAGVRMFYRTASFAQEIVSDDPRTVAGLDYLQSIGILTAARKNAILNGA